ncbi:CDP-glucose 4,6-dehydratase [Gammaproteobacteria bacterium]|nr:CDP-glucose 4,6-dehydratase [Gammaproteobacteria bacterium]
MEINTNFWKNKSVFITGHTGFKGSWASLLLQHLGANVTGYALEPNTEKNMFNISNVQCNMNSVISDIRDYDNLLMEIKNAEPEIIFHMAAQPLVRESYSHPIETYDINLMGTINLLNICREIASIKSVINVTTDKCYENKEWIWGYREDEPMGGYDPYSSSKACSEIATASFRRSYFNKHNYAEHGVGIATARAGNVIGGGDWSKDRLIPDIINSIEENKELKIRSLMSTRPWQHVLEPVYGYLILAEKLYSHGADYSEAWNFGPESSNIVSVKNILDKLNNLFPNKIMWSQDKSVNPHEASLLSLDISKAKNRLNWYPNFNIDKTLELVVDWHKEYSDNQNMREFSISQIKYFLSQL